ncbi:MAG TPA: class I SAM-dependent methyltransferase [Opitutaceae bacterium]|jgi:SAM-dependent methyltransferase|nr:class I SAM-dependent methyltransferase [Opitutaceae bacterium]
MGRFESTVPYYRRFRQPYPPAFFAGLARLLDLRGSEALIDIGCGPAPLALGFAPFVRRVCGIDPEPAMIADARAAAAEAGVGLALWEGRIEEPPPDAGTFELATIGRALHWLDPGAACAALERLVAAGGNIVIAGAHTPEAENPWLPAYEKLREGLRDGTPYRFDPAGFFAGSRFALQAHYSTLSEHTISVDILVGRFLSMSNTSPAALGPRVREAEEQLRAQLRPYAAADGSLREVVEARATIVSRAARGNSRPRTGSLVPEGP